MQGKLSADWVEAVAGFGADFGHMPNGAEFAQFVAINLPRRHSCCKIQMHSYGKHTHTQLNFCCILFGGGGPYKSLCALAGPKS